MMDRLEHVPGIRGDNRSLIFLPQYVNFDKTMNILSTLVGEKYRPSYDNLPTWMDAIGNPPLVKYHMGDDNKLVKRLSNLNFLMKLHFPAIFLQKSKFKF